MGFFRGGIGEGQKVIKTEGLESESKLVRDQSKIGAEALFAAAVYAIIIAILIGHWLALVLVLAWLVLQLYRAITCDIYAVFPHTYYPLWMRFSLGAVIASAMILWLWLGPSVVAFFWPPVYYVDGWMYMINFRTIPAPVWARTIAVILLSARAAFKYPLAYRMLVEILDPNWPPVYEQRDPDLGPWNPIQRNLGVVEAEAILKEADQDALPDQRLRVAVEHDDRPGWKEVEFDYNLMRRAARAITGTGRNWSNRDLRKVPGISANGASQILHQMEEGGLLAYPNGKNDPSGGMLTAKGEDLVDKLLDL